MQIRIAADRIHFLKFILEGYDGLAILTTIDAKTGLVRLAYPSEAENELFSLLEALATTITPMSGQEMTC